MAGTGDITAAIAVRCRGRIPRTVPKIRLKGEPCTTCKVTLAGGICLNRMCKEFNKR